MAAASALKRHGVGVRTSGGGSIFNNPVLASSASLRGDKHRPLRQQPPEGGCIYSLTGRSAAKGGCFADGGNRPPGVVLHGRERGVPMYLTSFVNMGLRKRQPPSEVIPRRKQAQGMCRRENLIVGAMPRIRDGAGARHGVGVRTSGGGYIFNNPVLASSASLRGDKHRLYGNNPRRAVASTRRTQSLRPKATALRGLLSEERLYPM